MANFWLPPDEKTGENASFIIDLGTVRKVDRFRIKNTRNADSATHRATQNFTIFMSNSTTGPWILIVRDVMNDSKDLVRKH